MDGSDEPRIAMVGCSALLQAAAAIPFGWLEGGQGRAGEEKKRRKSSYGDGFRALGKVEMSFVVLCALLQSLIADCESAAARSGSYSSINRVDWRERW
jgi:hypothetical protein